MRRGFTLPELTLVLALIATGSSLVLPSIRNRLDGLAASSAREAVAGALARARAEAPLRGGAVVRFDEPGLVRVTAAAEVLEVLELRREHGVELEIAGAPATAEVRYDALGIGRLANRTLYFRRGMAEASLVISAYGRVSRR